MKKQLFILVIAALLLVPGLCQAAPFSILGPRALGMGGASVAAVNDSTAVYWNPAALADFRKIDIRIPARAGVQDHIGLEEKWSRINDIYSQVQAHDPAAINEMLSLLNDLNKPNTGTDVDASAGLLISIPVSNSAIAVSAIAFGYAGMFPTIDTINMNPLPAAPNFVGNNMSTVTGIGMTVSEPAISFATSIGDRLFVGANVKKIYAQTFIASQILTTGDFDDFIDDLTDSKTESDKAALDAGILIAPLENLRIGLVGRNINSPSFEINSGAAIGDMELEAQYRAGLAWEPFETLTLAADCDLTKNETFTPGYESRIAAIGVEKTFLSEYFNLRAGVNKNLADSDARTIYTAGIGLRLFALRLDVAGGYDFDERQGEVSVDLALRF